MPVTAVFTSSPRYVLLDGNRPIGPKVMPLHAGIECAPIYGFSGKGSYEEFCTKSERPLKPYPLVKRYLQNRIDALGAGLKLVVMDAAGPTEPSVHAATMEAVLDAQEKRATGVTAEYRLVFDRETNTYWLADPV